MPNLICCSENIMKCSIWVVLNNKVEIEEDKDEIIDQINDLWGRGNDTNGLRLIDWIMETEALERIQRVIEGFLLVKSYSFEDKTLKPISYTSILYVASRNSLVKVSD